MIPDHWLSLMAEVPESVRRSMVTFSAGMPNGLRPDCLRRASRSRRVVAPRGSTILMRKGSIGGLISAILSSIAGPGTPGGAVSECRQLAELPEAGLDEVPIKGEEAA